MNADMIKHCHRTRIVCGGKRKMGSVVCAKLEFGDRRSGKGHHITSELIQFATKHYFHYSSSLSSSTFART